jgi:hypothetical protein
VNFIDDTSYSIRLQPTTRNIISRNAYKYITPHNMQSQVARNRPIFGVGCFVLTLSYVFDLFLNLETLKPCNLETLPFTPP